MGIHHDTSVQFILEDDSISLTFKACIHSCLGKGVGLWLIVRPSIHLFLAHSIFTLMLHFHFRTSSLLMCECRYGLNTYGTHLAHCLFKGQQIVTHDTIRYIKYAFAQENGHIAWREQWYVFTLGVSL
jgi:hypothetical protein